MAEMNGRSGNAWEPLSNLVSGDFAELSKKRLAAMVEMQKAFFDTIESMNQAWFERAKSEATLASELVTKLTAARSVPETASVYQECLGKRMDLLADDSRRLLSDGQRMVNLGARFLANGANGSENPKA